MNRIVPAVALVLGGCASARQEAAVQASPDEPSPTAADNSEIRNAFDHVDNGLYYSDF